MFKHLRLLSCLNSCFLHLYKLIGPSLGRTSYLDNSRNFSTWQKQKGSHHDEDALKVLGRPFLPRLDPIGLYGYGKNEFRQNGSPKRAKKHKFTKIDPPSCVGLPVASTANYTNFVIARLAIHRNFVIGRLATTQSQYLLVGSKRGWLFSCLLARTGSGWFPPAPDLKVRSWREPTRASTCQ